MADTVSTSFQTFCPAHTSPSTLKCQATCLDLLRQHEDCAFGTPVSTSGSEANSVQDQTSDTESKEEGDAGTLQKEDVCIEQAANMPGPSSSVDWDQRGEQILRLTQWYLQELRLKLPNSSFEEVLKAMDTAKCAYSSGEEGSQWGHLALLLHGLRIASLLPTSPIRTPQSCKKNSRKRHLKSKRNPGKSQKIDQIKTIPTKMNGEPKAKTGRKPQIYECFICHEVQPYKVNLIQHFQAAHNVKRSQSLLYKRVNQSPDAMKRLYCL